MYIESLAIFYVYVVLVLRSLLTCRGHCCWLSNTCVCVLCLSRVIDDWKREHSKISLVDRRHTLLLILLRYEWWNIINIITAVGCYCSKRESRSFIGVFITLRPHKIKCRLSWWTRFAVKRITHKKLSWTSWTKFWLRGNLAIIHWS